MSVFRCLFSTSTLKSSVGANQKVKCFEQAPVVSSSSAPEARPSELFQFGVSRSAMDTSRTQDPSENLRLRSCFRSSCHVVFTFGLACDRGQRYCSAACRQRMWREQVRAAVRRYQASAQGRFRRRTRHRGPPALVALHLHLSHSAHSDKKGRDAMPGLLPNRTPVLVFGIMGLVDTRVSNLDQGNKQVGYLFPACR